MFVSLKALNPKVVQYTSSVRIMFMPTCPEIPLSVLQKNDYRHKAIPPQYPGSSFLYKNQGRGLQGGMIPNGIYFW